MPSELVETGFEAIAEDTSFSPKMRNKFQAGLENRLLEDYW